MSGRATVLVVPATHFDDVAQVIGPRRPDANVCWCLTYRIASGENRRLVGPSRGERFRELMQCGPVGVLAYENETPVGWAAVAPRAQTTFVRSRTIPKLDEPDPWCIWCLRVRPGYRGRGISRKLIEGAIEYARDKGARILEAYPVENAGKKINTTMAYVGTRRLFESCGFKMKSETMSVIDGFPRILMSRNLKS